jgi:hypothetical protein
VARIFVQEQLQYQEQSSRTNNEQHLMMILEGPPNPKQGWDRYRGPFAHDIPTNSVVPKTLTCLA